MNSAEATLIIRSLLGRLSEEQSGYILPGGRLSAIEVSALRDLIGEQAETSSAPAGDGQGELATKAVQRPSVGDVTHSSGGQGGGLSEVNLVLASVGVSGPDEADMRLCLDFGTALSKAWAAYDAITEPIVLNLGKAVGESDGLPVPSTIFVSGSGRIYFGDAAVRQHRQELHASRQRFDNIKRILSEAETRQDLHEVPVESTIDPTSSGITKGDLLVLYLAWLTDHALKALLESVSAEAEDLSDDDLIRLRSIRRQFAIPCFENAVEETSRGEARASWARAVMRDSMLRAQIVADTLSDMWEGLHLNAALPVLRTVRDVDLSQYTHLLASRPTVREPIAAGASRFGDQVDEEDQRSRKFLLVVDAGAGTTDFAMFQVFIDPDRQDEEVRYALIPSTVRMSRIAGNEVDAVLRPLFLEAAGINPSNGAPRSQDDFQLIGRDLDSQLRDLKQLLFVEGRAIFTLRPNVSGMLKKKAIEANRSYQKLGRKLLEIRDGLTRALFARDEEFLNVVRRVNETSGKAMPIFVLLTGGSSTVPIIEDLGRGDTVVGGARFEYSKVRELPTWVDRLDREVRDLLAQPYRQCAVAIGGAAPILPVEIEDLFTPVTPVLDEKWTLEKFPTQGI